jgi:hypothetical protein
MATTSNLGITLVDQSQSQKEVTINEGFSTLDAFAPIGTSGTATATSSTSFADIAGMSVNLLAAGVYTLQINGIGTADIAAGFKLGSAGTATFTNFNAFGWIDNSGAYAGGFEASASGSLVNLTATTNFRFSIAVTVTVNAAGTLKLQFAQNVSNATASNLSACWMAVQRIA